MEDQSAARSAPAETSRPEERALPTKPARKAKRPRGTGSIFKMGKYFYLAYYLPNGFQKTESSRSTLKSVAQEMLRDRLEKIRQGLYCETPPRKVTFQMLVEDLLADYAISRRHTIGDAKSRIENHLRPFFGNYLAAAITTEKAREYLLLRRAEGAADGTVQNELALLKRLLSLASRATPPKVARVQNVDLLNRLVRLNAGETKNGDGRVIPLGDELLESLKSQLHLRNTTVPDCPLVFFRIIKTKENPVARWLPIGDFRKVWDSACAKSGLTGRIFHDLRRSAIRALIRSGVQERVAMMISGHKTRSVFDRYKIVSEQDLTDAVRKLQRFQEAAEPARQPAQAVSSSPADRPEFVN